MADHEALADAERLRDEAAALLAAIDREIAALEAARDGAREGMARAERAAGDNGEHAAWLGAELEAGRALQAQAAERLAAGAAARREMAVRIGRELDRPPAVAATGAAGGVRARRVAAALPAFRSHTRALLAATPLGPAFAFDHAWAETAFDHPALGDRARAALRLLDEAEATAGAALADSDARRRARARPAARPRSRRDEDLA